jgi:hypothetical protein
MTITLLRYRFERLLTLRYWSIGLLKPKGKLKDRAPGRVRHDPQPAGVDLTKPFKGQELLEAIRDAVQL